jgi:hypothetical protein
VRVRGRDVAAAVVLCVVVEAHRDVLICRIWNDDVGDRVSRAGAQCNVAANAGKICGAEPWIQKV